MDSMNLNLYDYLYILTFFICVTFLIFVYIKLVGKEQLKIENKRADYIKEIRDYLYNKNNYEINYSVVEVEDNKDDNL